MDNLTSKVLQEYYCELRVTSLFDKLLRFYIFRISKYKTQLHLSDVLNFTAVKLCKYKKSRSSIHLYFIFRVHL